MQVIFAEHTSVAAWRPIVEQLLQGCVFSSPMLFTIDDLFAELRAGAMQLWLFTEAEGEAPCLFVVTRIEQYPRGKICTIYLAAGRRLRLAMAWRGQFEAWCKMMKCDYVHYLCNEKLMRIMRPFGYTPTAYAVFKPLYTMN